MPWRRLALFVRFLVACCFMLLFKSPSECLRCVRACKIIKQFCFVSINANVMTLLKFTEHCSVEFCVRTLAFAIFIKFPPCLSVSIT